MSGRLRGVARSRNVVIVKHASNKPATSDDRDLSIVVGEHADAVQGFWHGWFGQTVRCVPWRRTLMGARRAEGASNRGREVTLYAKLHRRRRRVAAAEWRWLHMLPMLGIATAVPVAWMADRLRAMVVTEAVAGRSLDAWAVDASREGWLPQLFDYACREVAPFARRLHAAGLIHRDLNCAHLFASDPRTADAPAIIDVERMCRPRLRWRRWIVKELASLLQSAPVAVPIRVRLRFLRVYAPERSKAQRRGLLEAISRKAERAARHEPKYG